MCHQLDNPTRIDKGIPQGQTANPEKARYKVRVINYTHNFQRSFMPLFGRMVLGGDK